MALVLVLTFSIISISLNELSEAQSMQIEYIAARTQAEYAAYSGVVHGNIRMTEDISRDLTEGFVPFFNYYRRYCVAWAENNQGQVLCNTKADPNNPCCYEKDGTCLSPSQQGVCQSRHYWRSEYLTHYDAMRKSIISSAVLSFEPDADSASEFSDRVLFQSQREMSLSWE